MSSPALSLVIPSAWIPMGLEKNMSYDYLLDNGLSDDLWTVKLVE